MKALTFSPRTFPETHSVSAMTSSDKPCVADNARALPAEFDISSFTPAIGAGALPGLKVTNRADGQVFGCRRLKLPASTQDLHHFYQVRFGIFRVICP